MNCSKANPGQKVLGVRRNGMPISTGVEGCIEIRPMLSDAAPHQDKASSNRASNQGYNYFVSHESAFYTTRFAISAPQKVEGAGKGAGPFEDPRLADFRELVCVPRTRSNAVGTRVTCRPGGRPRGEALLRTGAKESFSLGRVIVRPLVNRAGTRRFRVFHEGRSYFRQNSSRCPGFSRPIRP